MNLRDIAVEPIKRALDRRYMRLEPVQSRDQYADPLARANLNSRLADIEQRLDEIETTHASARLGADFVNGENPHELRKRLFTAHRLANECAVAIERLLQADIILQRDLDELSGATSKAGEVH